MSSLTDAVRAGRTAEVVALLDGMTDAERRAVFPELKALRKELRAEWWTSQSQRAYRALHAAGAACQTGAAAVATWLAASDMRWAQASPGVLIDILGDRDADWLADVTQRLAQRPASAGVQYELMAGLVRLSGCPVPTTDAYVQGWAQHIGHVRQRGGTLLDRLCRDPHLSRLVAALFETADIAGWLEWPKEEGPNSWPGALARLTTEGVLERDSVVDACVARLLRGGSAADHRVFLRLLTALDLTRDEQRQHIADWLALASDAVPTVAAQAQSVLAALALDGDLTSRQLADLSAAVLFRTEKKLVRAQLVLVGKVLTRDPSWADVLLPVVAQAFGHDDADVQERALKLVERHVGKVGSAEVRGELAEAAEQLIPALRMRAVRSLGASPGQSALLHEEILPPVPEPARVAPAPGSAAEVAEEVGVLMASEGDVATFERALDGLVRQAHGNHDRLLAVLELVLDRRWWYSTASGTDHDVRADARFDARFVGFTGTEEALDLVLAALTGRVRTATLHRAVQYGTRARSCPHSALAAAFDARVWEVAYRMRTDPLPFLLSTPTWSTGLLEPDELVERLDAYRRLGARVAEADFGQALLRVRREDRTAAARAADKAAALGTPEGERLAEWLTSAEPDLPSHRRLTSGPRILVEFAEHVELQDHLPAPLRALNEPTDAFVERRGYCPHWDDSIRQHWLALVPERRELVAVRLLRELSEVAMDDGRGAAVLPLLAESGGEAGEGVHLGVAYGLGARHPEDRLAAVDALLVLAARGQLDAARLGRDLGALVHGGAVKPLRLAESARTAAATGANATIWSVLRHALPVLLADLPTDGPIPATGPARGLGELLSVAAECAERSGARGDLPYLARAVGRGGSSRLVSQARRLHGALAEREVAA